MMNFTGFLACSLVARTCVERALGDQVLFAQKYAGVWWVFVVIWALSAAVFFLKAIGVVK